MKLENIFKKLKEKITTFPNRFSYFLLVGLILASFILAAAIFWSYAWKGSSPKTQLQEETKLNIELYKKVEKELKQKEKNIEEIEKAQISDPFK